MIGLSFGLVGMVVLLLAGGLFVINTEAFQNKMLDKAVEMHGGDTAILLGDTAGL